MLSKVFYTCICLLECVLGIYVLLFASTSSRWHKWRYAVDLILFLLPLSIMLQRSLWVAVCTFSLLLPDAAEDSIHHIMLFYSPMSGHLGY